MLLSGIRPIRKVEPVNNVSDKETARGQQFKMATEKGKELWNKVSSYDGGPSFRDMLSALYEFEKIPA